MTTSYDLPMCFFMLDCRDSSNPRVDCLNDRELIDRAIRIARLQDDTSMSMPARVGAALAHLKHYYEREASPFCPQQRDVDFFDAGSPAAAKSFLEQADARGVGESAQQLVRAIDDQESARHVANLITSLRFGHGLHQAKTSEAATPA